MLGRQIELSGDVNENVPLYYHIVDNFQIQFGREEFCLVSGLKFRVEYWTDYNDAVEPIPFRRWVFPSSLDGQPIRGKMLVLLGVEDRRAVPDWILRNISRIRGTKKGYNQMMKKSEDMYDKMTRFMEDMRVGPVTQANTEPIIVDQHYRISDMSGFQSMHMDPHFIGTLDGSMRPYPSWNDVNWVYMPINAEGNHWVTGAVNLADSIFYVFDSMESERRMLMLEQQKFNLEANYPLNLYAKLSSFDDIFDITDDPDKFNLEANYPLNLYAKLSSFDDIFDITDDPDEATGVKVSRDVGARLIGLKNQNIKALTLNQFILLEICKTGNFPQHIQKAIPPRMDNPQPGSPKNTNRIQSQGEEPRVIHCTRCKQAGHKRDNCNKPFIFEPPINIRTQHGQEIL
nr:transposase, MuDR, MULE transposase domain protein [Tanacetum cinerariifolium]